MGGCNVLDFKIYLFTDSRQLAAGAGFNALFISHHVLGSVDAMQFTLQALNQQSWFLHACTQSHHSGAHFVFTPFFVVCMLWYVPTLTYLWYLPYLPGHKHQLKDKM
jgi:hypothetical protein